MPRLGGRDEAEVKPGLYRRVSWSRVVPAKAENLWIDQRAAPKHFPSPSGSSGTAAHTGYA